MLASAFTSKITELLMMLISTQFEEFSNELFEKIQNKDINSIDDIRELWNSKSKDNILNVSNSSVVLKFNKNENVKENNKNESVKENNTCIAILNKGKKKGEQCGRKCKKDTNYCYSHRKNTDKTDIDEVKKDKQNEEENNDDKEDNDKNKDKQDKQDEEENDYDNEENEDKEEEICMEKPKITTSNFHTYNKPVNNLSKTIRNNESDDESDDESDNETEDKKISKISYNEDDSDDSESSDDSDDEKFFNNCNIKSNQEVCNFMLKMFGMSTNEQNINNNKLKTKDNENISSETEEESEMLTTINLKNNKKTTNEKNNKIQLVENEYGELDVIGHKIPTNEERYENWYKYLSIEEKKDKENVKMMWEERERRRQITIVEMKKLQEAREKIKKQGQPTIEELKKEMEEKEIRWQRALEIKRIKDRGETVVYTQDEIEREQSRKKMTEMLQRKFVDDEYCGGMETKAYEKFMNNDEISDNEAEEIRKNTIIMTKEQKELAKKKRDERIAQHWKNQDEQERTEREEKERQEELQRIERKNQERELKIQQEEETRIRAEEEREREEKEKRKRKFREITEKRERMIREGKLKE